MESVVQGLPSIFRIWWRQANLSRRLTSATSGSANRIGARIVQSFRDLVSCTPASLSYPSQPFSWMHWGRFVRCQPHPFRTDRGINPDSFCHRNTRVRDARDLSFTEDASSPSVHHPRSQERSRSRENHRDPDRPRLCPRKLSRGTPTFLKILSSRDHLCAQGGGVAASYRDLLARVN